MGFGTFREQHTIEYNPSNIYVAEVQLLEVIGLLEKLDVEYTESFDQIIQHDSERLVYFKTKSQNISFQLEHLMTAWYEAGYPELGKTFEPLARQMKNILDQMNVPSGFVNPNTNNIDSIEI